MTTTSSSSTPSLLNVLNLVAYITNVAFVFGVPTWFDLPDNGTLSQKYQTLVTPAGWAFAIWGLIFLMQGIWAIVQIVVPSLRNNALVTQGVAWNYIGVCASQVAWTFTFALEQINLSMISMLGILFFLFRIYQAQQQQQQQESITKYWLLRFPFELHLGWITAATLVNINVVLVAHKNNILTSNVQFYAAMLSLLVPLIVTSVVLFKESEKPGFPNVVVPLVLVWALNAISVELKNPKDLITSTFASREIEIVQHTAFTVAILMLISCLVIVARYLWKTYANNNNRVSHRQTEQDAPLLQQN